MIDSERKGKVIDMYTRRMKHSTILIHTAGMLQYLESTEHGVINWLYLRALSFALTCILTFIKRARIFLSGSFKLIGGGAIN